MSDHDRDPASARRITRRRFLIEGAAAGLFAARSLVAGEALPLPPPPAPPAPPEQGFRFVVLNDTHVRDARCIAFLRKAIASIKAISRELPIDFALHLGDIVTAARPAEFELFLPLVEEFGMPLYLVPGNHDCTDTDRSAYDRRFAKMVNYRFDHKGWRFIGFDSTMGTKSSLTKVQPATVRYLTEELARTDRSQPIVAFTHFPFARGMIYRPIDADDVLGLFARHRFAGLLSGHFHGQTVNRFRDALLTTGRCLSVSRENHDASREKGFLLFGAAQGELAFRFVEVKP